MPTNYSNGYWTEGKIVNGTNVGGGVFVQGPNPNTTPSPAPTPTPTPTPTPASTTITPPRTPSLLEQAQNDLVTAEASRSFARAQADSYAAQQRQLRIDAINQAFAPRIQREQAEGEQRLARVSALNLRSGIVGSGVDTTRTGEQKGLNEKAIQAIEAERAAAISEIFGWADELARTRASDIYEESKAGAEANVARYSAQADQALEALKILGASGVEASSLQSVDPKVYSTLRDVAGMSDAQIDAYLKANAPEGVYQWNAAQVNGSKMMVPKVVNGKVSMETIDMGFTPGKEYKTTVKTDDGVLVIYSDGTYDVIGSKSGSGVKLKEGAPSWEEYLTAAEDAATEAGGPNSSNVSFSEAGQRMLRNAYNRAYVLTDISDFTETEKRKLEQAGLLTATRQEQLDHLYKKTGGLGDFDSIPTIEE